MLHSAMAGPSLLRDMIVIFSAAVGVSLLGARVGLPSLAGMLLAGTLIGPHALGLIDDPERAHTLAEMGVALLLFGVGIELPFGRLRELFRPMVVGGSLQVLGTGLLTFLLASGFRLSPVAALLVAFVTVPSSTAIVLRRLHARGELEAPHGRQMLGILLFQDVCVVPMMLVLPALTNAQLHGALSILLEVGSSFAVLSIVVLVARVLAPKLLHVVASVRQRDLFVLAVFVVVIGTAWAASLANVSLALGAFLAGVVVAGSEYRHQALGELMPFREVFASLFFVSAGMLLDGTRIARDPGLVLSLLFAIVLLKALVVLLLCALMRVSLRASVLTAVGLAQVGEFSLVLLDSVQETRTLESTFEGALLSASILSLIATPLLAMLAPRVAELADRSRTVRRFWSARDAGRTPLAARNGHVVIAGYGVAGKTLAHRLAGEGVEPVIVDLNGTLVREAVRDGFAAYYGDVTTPEVLELLEVERARELVLLISDPTALERAVVQIRRLAPRLVLTVRARYEGEMSGLHALGADHVIAAETEAGRTITTQVVQRNSRRPTG